MPNANSYEQKILSLLLYALEKEGVPENSYFIGNDGDELTQDDKLCLLNVSQGNWVVLYIERGSVSQRALHLGVREAAKHFFWKLTKPDTPWNYRSEWEIKTGQTL